MSLQDIKDRAEAIIENGTAEYTIGQAFKIVSRSQMDIVKLVAAPEAIEGCARALDVVDDSYAGDAPYRNANAAAVASLIRASIKAALA